MRQSFAVHSLLLSTNVHVTHLFFALEAYGRLFISTGTDSQQNTYIEL